MTASDALPGAVPTTEAEPAGPTDRSLRPLLSLRPYLLRYPAMLAAALAALIVSSLAMLSVPTAVRRMIDHGFSSADSAYIDSIFVSLIVIGAVLAIASASRFYCVNWLGERVVADLRADVFEHLLRLGPAFHDNTRTGDVMSRLTADTTQLKTVSGSTLSQALRNTIMLIGAVVLMLITSPLLTGLVGFAIPAIVLPLMAAGRRVQGRSRDAQDTLADASAYAAENLAAIRTVQATVSEHTVSRRFGAAVERAFEAARTRLLARAGLTAITMFIVVASVVGVLWFGASRVVTGTMSAGTLSQFLLYALFAGGALAELAEVWGELKQASGAAERLIEIRSIVPDIEAPKVPLPLPTPPIGTLRFDAVDFHYPGRTELPALRGLSFEVKRGETVALVGPSGAGKSTVLALALRFYDPSAGRVFIDGVPLDRVDPKDARRRLAVVPQEVALFADTVAENIRYGRPDASESEIERAARAAQADGFVRALPQGYGTLIGERGVTLSGGQRQRIALARALLRDSPILLLDEATSALDAESEVAVQTALEAAMRERTTLVIAHRLATIQKADRILVMDRGRIVEEGTHASLVAKGGLYARLADLQFGRLAAE